MKSEIWTKTMEIAAVWMNSPIEISRAGKQIKAVRITYGDCVRIENLKVKESGLATHKVIRCLGNITSTYLMLEVESLINNDERLIISLK